MGVIELCVVVLTIIFGMVGIYFLIVLHSTRQVLAETRQTLKAVNGQLPELMKDLQVSVEKLRLTTESVQGGVEQASAVMGALSPVALTTSLLGGAKGSWERWRKIRSHNNDNRNSVKRNNANQNNAGSSAKIRTLRRKGTDQGAEGRG